jgi:hypothetical protein
MRIHTVQFIESFDFTEIKTKTVATYNWRQKEERKDISEKAQLTVKDIDKRHCQYQ